MKKRKKITLIVAGCLVGLGLILVLSGMASIGFDPNNLRSSDYHTEYYEIPTPTPIRRVSIDGGSSDVHIYPSDYDTYRVVYTENDHVPLEVFTTGSDTLSIRRDSGFTWHIQFGIYLGETGISVYLPKQQYESLSVRTSGGNITVSEDLEFASATVQSASGDLDISGFSLGKLAVDTQSGNIHIANAAPEALQVHSASGEIALENIAVSTSLQVHSVSGNVAFDDVTGETMAVSTTSGDISFAQTLGKGKIRLDSTSGNVTLTGCDAEELSILTASGDVFGTLLSGKVFQIGTVSGVVNVPYSGTGGKCDITTTSGDIHIAIGDGKA